MFGPNHQQLQKPQVPKEGFSPGMLVAKSLEPNDLHQGIAGLGALHIT
jgi:hypothetical protein